MPYDWTSEEQGADKVQPGRHQLRIQKVLTGFNSSKGDPKILVIFGDDTGAEASEGFVLSVAAAWTLRRLLKRSGVDCDDLNARGIEPLHFTDKQLAESILVGRSVWCDVTHELGRDGKTYTRVTPLDSKDIPAEAILSGAQPVAQADDSDIPF